MKASLNSALEPGMIFCGHRSGSILIILEVVPGEEITYFEDGRIRRWPATQSWYSTPAWLEYSDLM